MQAVYFLNIIQFHTLASPVTTISTDSLLPSGSWLGMHGIANEIVSSTTRESNAAVEILVTG